MHGPLHNHVVCMVHLQSTAHRDLDWIASIVTCTFVRVNNCTIPLVHHIETLSLSRSLILSLTLCLGSLRIEGPDLLSTFIRQSAPACSKFSL